MFTRLTLSESYEFNVVVRSSWYPATLKFVPCGGDPILEISSDLLPWMIGSYGWLVVTGTWLLFSHILGIVIPIDELILFRGVAQPPTSHSLARSIHQLVYWDGIGFQKPRKNAVHIQMADADGLDVRPPSSMLSFSFWPIPFDSVLHAVLSKHSHGCWPILE